MNKNEKTIVLNYNIILYALIGLLVLVGIFLIISNINNKEKSVISKNDQEDIKEIIYKNVIGNIETITTKIDLESIFINNPTNFNSIIDGDNIYYFYNPEHCYNNSKNRLDLEERINNCLQEQKSKCTDATSSRADCQKDYCQNYFRELNDLLGNNNTPRLPICELFDPDNNKEYIDLNKIYLVSHNLNSNTLNTIDTFEANSQVSLNLITDKYLYYSFITNNNMLTKQYDKKTNNILNLKDNYKIIKLNNILYAINENKELIGKYDEDSNKILDKEMLLYTNYTIDKYTNALYSYKNNKIYKNAEIIYQLSTDKTIEEVFATFKYIYIIYSQNNKLEMLKLAKEDNKVIENIKINSDITKIKYQFINSASEPIFIVNNNIVYTFKEKEKTFQKLYLINSNSNIEIYHNYLIFIKEKELVIYNTITNSEKRYNDLLYYYLNTFQKRIYILNEINNNLSLKYIDID